MSDLIDRQDAIYAIDKHIHTFDAIDRNYLDGLRTAMSFLKELPSAQPGITLESAIDYLHSIGWMQEHDRTLTESAQPEQKKGKWIELEPKGVWTSVYHCSECGGAVMSCKVDLPNYCGHCGADMRGDTDEAD